MTDREAAAGLVEYYNSVAKTGVLIPYTAQINAKPTADLITTLLSELERVGKERDEAWEIVAACNNSVFGTHSYFADANGKTTAQGIEEIKDFSGAQWLRANDAEARTTKAEALVAEAVTAMQAMLTHSCVSDIPAEDKFDEDHEAERAARAFIEKAKS